MGIDPRGNGKATVLGGAFAVVVVSTFVLTLLTSRVLFRVVPETPKTETQTLAGLAKGVLYPRPRGPKP